MLKRIAVSAMTVLGLIFAGIQARGAGGWKVFWMWTALGLVLSYAVALVWGRIEKGSGKVQSPRFTGELAGVAQSGVFTYGYEHGDDHVTSGFRGTLFLVNTGATPANLRSIHVDASRLHPPAIVDSIDVDLPAVFQPAVSQAVSLFVEVTFREVNRENAPKSISLAPLIVKAIDAFGDSHPIRIRPGESFQPFG